SRTIDRYWRAISSGLWPPRRPGPPWPVPATPAPTSPDRRPYTNKSPVNSLDTTRHLAPY
ncbi:hypothetical protein, partial [Streptomyces sp. NPDC047123]|uniref:hypothetical protein n=1 Tax=Streptomyces sp. NPDC047123 TaxID=3155622 RepID=UPI0033E2F1A9